MSISSKEFTFHIKNKLDDISNEYIDLTSGDIHRELGEYPGRNHRIPSCCNVMMSLMKKNDIILTQPRKGKGATLTIRYYKR